MRRRLYPLVVAAGLAVGSLIPVSGALGASANGMARRQLNTALPEVKLEGVAFSDALDFLRDISGINMTVNWKALETAGVSKEAPVTLRLRAISLRKALQMVLSEAGGGDTLAYDIDEGVVEITTKEQADSRMITKVYPIEDLIMDIPDFTDAPEFDLNAISNQQSQNGGGAGGGVGGGGGYSGGGGGSGSNGLFGGSSSGGSNGSSREAPGKSKQQRADELVDLIRSIVQPDIWQENGGKAAIRYWQGNLIITAPRSVHEAIGGPVD
jgi:uncharacterized membrane protein YgcG